MKFVVINPKLRAVTTVEERELRDALLGAGVDPDKVDHGLIDRRLGYVVFEYGLFMAPGEQDYFGMNGRLIAGTAVLYGINEAGETVDTFKAKIPDVRFYLGANDVEAAIERGEIARPKMSVNGEEIWAWPSPPPKGAMRGS